MDSYGKGRNDVIIELMDHFIKEKKRVAFAKSITDDTYIRAHHAGVISTYSRVLTKLRVKLQKVESFQIANPKS